LNATRLVPLLLFLAALLRAQIPLENAWRAQALLGPEVWSRVITVRNESADSRYPGTVHALVFEVAGILWFYTDTDGTQSFSLHVGQLEQEKNDFGPPLQDIEPGFVRWKIHDGGAAHSLSAAHGPLPNGCFIESVVALRERLAGGVNIEKPRLLSYYLRTRVGQKGHTVLAYDTGQRVEVFDPSRPHDRFVFDRKVATDAVDLARAVEGCDIKKARFVFLRVGGSEANIAAAVEFDSSLAMPVQKG
jgi:hypothetical protein